MEEPPPKKLRAQHESRTESGDGPDPAPSRRFLRIAYRGPAGRKLPSGPRPGALFPPLPAGSSVDDHRDLVHFRKDKFFPYDFGVDVEGMGLKQRSAYLSSLPAKLKERFRKPFLKRYRNNEWWPVLIMSPLDVNAETRQLFETKWAKAKGSLRPLECSINIVYYYGVPVEHVHERYDICPFRDLRSYENIDESCLKKQKNGKKMTKHDKWIVEGFRQIQADALKEPQDKVSWIYSEVGFDIIESQQEMQHNPGISRGSSSILKRKRSPTVGSESNQPDSEAEVSGTDFSQRQPADSREATLEVEAEPIEGWKSGGLGTSKQHKKEEPVTLAGTCLRGEVSFENSDVSRLLVDINSNEGKRGARWVNKFKVLMEYKNKYGHMRVCRDRVLGDRLVHWVGKQRNRRDTLSAKRKKCLELVNFQWNQLNNSDTQDDTASSASKATSSSLVRASVPNIPSSIKNVIAELRREKGFKPHKGNCWILQFIKHWEISSTKGRAKMPPSSWAKDQRKELKRRSRGKRSPLTNGRIKALISIGFWWGKSMADGDAKAIVMGRWEVIAGIEEESGTKESREEETRKQECSSKESADLGTPSMMEPDSAVPDVFNRREDDIKQILENLRSEAKSTQHCESWIKHFLQILKFRSVHEHDKIPYSSWVNEQRVTLRKRLSGKESPLTDGRIQALLYVDFSWGVGLTKDDANSVLMRNWKGKVGARGGPRYNEDSSGAENIVLVDYRPNVIEGSDTSGTVSVELTNSAVPSSWSKIDFYQIVTELKREAGSQILYCNIWIKHFRLLWEFRSFHEHAKMPGNEWVKEQRRYFRQRIKGKRNSLTAGRIKALLAVGFWWGEGLTSADAKAIVNEMKEGTVDDRVRSKEDIYRNCETEDNIFDSRKSSGVSVTIPDEISRKTIYEDPVESINPDSNVKGLPISQTKKIRKEEKALDDEAALSTLKKNSSNINQEFLRKFQGSQETLSKSQDSVMQELVEANNQVKNFKEESRNWNLKEENDHLKKENKELKDELRSIRKKLRLEISNNNENTTQMLNLDMHANIKYLRGLTTDATKAAIDAGLPIKRKIDKDVPSFLEVESNSRQHTVPWNNVKKAVFTPGDAIRHLSSKLEGVQSKLKESKLKGKKI